MNLPRPKRFVIGVLAAVALSVVSAGCGSGPAAEVDSREASDEGRASFILPAADSAPGESTGDQGPTVPDPVEPEINRIASEPVTAPQPATSEKPAIELAAAERPNGAPSASNVSRPADPSRFPGGIVPASLNAQPLPGGPRLLVPERTFRAEGRPPALRVSYDDLDLLRVLNMGDPLPADVVEHFPQWLKDLDGKTVRLRGFMYPSYEEELSKFILTRDTGECCFGPKAKVYYLVGVKLKDGTTARYVENRPFDVVGTFHIDPRYVDGTWYRLYRITDAVVPE